MEKKSILLSQSDFEFLSEHLEKAVMKDYNKSRLKEEIKNAKTCPAMWCLCIPKPK
jgi:hypothetical protein